MIKKESDEYREPRNVVITLKDNQVLKVFMKLLKKQSNL